MLFELCAEILLLEPQHFVTFMQHGSEKGDLRPISGISEFVTLRVAVMLKNANGSFPAAIWIDALSWDFSGRGERSG